MSGREIKAGKGYVEIGIRNRIAKGAAGVEADLKKLGRRVQGIGAGAIGASAAILGPLVAATSGFAATGDAVHKMSLRTGVSAKALTGLGFAAEQSGSNISAVEKGFAGLSRSLLDLERGGANSVDTFDRIGLSLSDLQGLSPEDQMMKIADALNNVSDASTRGALAQQIFGRSGRDLLPLLAEGSAGMRKLTDEAASLGRVLTDEDAANAAAFTDAMNRVKTVIGGVVNQVGAALAPALTEIADLIASTSMGLVNFVRDNRGMIQVVAAVAAGIGIAGGALVGFGTMLTIVGAGVSGIAGAIGFLMSPIGLAIGGLALLGGALVKYTDIGVKALDWLKEKFEPLIATVKDAGAAIIEAFATGNIEAAWEMAMLAMESVWLDLTGGLQDSWGEAVDWVLNKGTDMAAGLGSLFSSLGDMLQGLLEGYEKYYNKVYDGVVDLGGDITGVKTVGGKSNAFEANLGGTKSSLEKSINQIREFGKAMEESTIGQKEQRAAEREAAKRERELRAASLRAVISQSGKDARESADKRKAEAPKGDTLADKLKKLEEELAKGLPSLAELPTRDELQAGTGNQRSGPSGTFSAFAASVIGSGDNGPANRTATATEKSAEWLGIIAAKLPTNNIGNALDLATGGVAGQLGGALGFDMPDLSKIMADSASQAVAVGSAIDSAMNKPERIMSAMGRANTPINGTNMTRVLEKMEAHLDNISDNTKRTTARFSA
ncbi:MAG: hypothetical protein KDB00_28770 [Planctomycetales bacterium]|nr:hypothetical protein [Planctomycetales bacterium]